MDKAELESKLLAMIPVGNKGRTFSPQDLTARLTLDKGSNDYKALMKKINRTLTGWQNIGIGLVVEQKGRNNYCYWQSQKQRDNYFNKFKDDAMDEGQALGMYLLETHLAEVIPPRLKRLLELKFNAATEQLLGNDNVLNIVDEWKGQIQVNPYGIALQNTAEVDQQYEAVFAAIEKQQVLQVEYNSMHTQLNERGQLLSSESFTQKLISPQQMLWQNNQMSVLVIVHEQGKPDVFKSFALARLKNIKPHEGDQHYVKRQQNYTTEKVVLHLQTGLKNYFEQVKLAAGQRISHLQGEWWQLEADISFADSFHLNPETNQSKGPDYFYLVNLLSSYGPSVEVIAPKPMREQMAQRAKEMAAKYSQAVQEEE
ncbi:WYL domain-containing protein [Paraferrimonas sp. SM1919]|uniref:WYL domain-containing protein n=1 Tax=Paraferrimonas sp. SM1919 TaxID=2662263 RepID=UPI0013D06FAC|nr:WYL domain-containing protein [Paraferrimonas sp. SM1919]